MAGEPTLVEIGRELIELIRKEVADPSVLLERRTDDLESALGDLPSEKPLPDAPGWWVRLATIYKIDLGTDGRLWGHATWLADWDKRPGDRWYGPLALPWEAT